MASDTFWNLQYPFSTRIIHVLKTHLRNEWWSNTATCCLPHYNQAKIKRLGPALNRSIYSSSGPPFLQWKWEERFENTGCDMDTGQEPATKSHMWKRGMIHEISAVCCREKLLLYSASHHWELPTWKAHRYNLTFRPSMSSSGWNHSRSDRDMQRAALLSESRGMRAADKIEITLKLFRGVKWPFLNVLRGLDHGWMCPYTHSHTFPDSQKKKTILSLKVLQNLP